MTGEGTILLVDDDLIDRMAFERYAKKHNFPYDYMLAGSVDEASKILERERFDAVILDYMLGDGTAFDLFDQLSDVPFILVTGLGDAGVAVKAMKAGAADYLIKDSQGVYLQTLPHTIKNAVQNKRNEQELARYRQHLEALVDERTATLSKEITERKRTEADLRQSETRWQMTFDAITDMVTIHDTDSNMLQMNRATTEFFGKGASELVGRKCYEVFCSEGRVCEHCPSLALRKDLLPHSAEIVHKDCKKTFFVSVSPIFNEDQEFIGVLHIAKDITDWKLLEDQLHQSRKMEAIGTLAGGIAHDFNNILTPIIGYSELLRMKVEPEGMVKNGLDIILQSARRASELVQQILSYSRQQHQKMATCHIQPIVKETLKLMRSTLPTTIEIRQVVDMDCGPVKADLTQIHQLMMNLCTNSSHAMAEDGGILEVTLSCLKLQSEECHRYPALSPGAHLCLEVSDTGSGMDPKTRERIFEPYFTTKEKGKGTGLGLAVVHGIVTAHKGHIEVSSEPGQGTVFRILMPMAEEEVVQGEEVVTTVLLPTGTEHILMVDDEPLIVEVNRKILISLGYRVTSETSSNKAMEQFRAQQDDFDLIITDLTMPGLTGIELTKEILKIRPEIPIILCTGFSEQANSENALDLGIREYLHKPVTIRNMATVVRRVLDDGTRG
jgi:PAS domain S-box-containing protein